MITLHHLSQSRSKRIIWLLEELEMAYELVKHQRDPATNLAPESLKLVHLLCKAPVIEDVVDDQKYVLSESGAIVEYILNKVPGNTLRPAVGAPDYVNYLTWLHFAEGSLSLPIISKLILGMESRDGTKPMDGYIAKELGLDFAYIEQTLAAQAYFSGDAFSAADIMMTFMLEAAQKLGVLTNHPNTLAFIEKMKTRKAYIKADSFG